VAMLSAEDVNDVLASSELLYSKHEVENSLRQMASSICQLLADKNPVVVCVLNGGVVPFGILLPDLNFPLQVDYLHATRYRGSTKGSHVEWISSPRLNAEGRTILLVDDILDEGTTLAAIEDYYNENNAREIYKAVLIEKERERTQDIAADFVGLKVPDRYVFGYGMDYKSYLRNAPGIYALKDKE
jgi:hypoxanthine phosphoribosyltransferase